MLKTIGKTALVLVGIIFLPILMIILGTALGVALPIIGVVGIILLPIIAIGIVIGYLSGKRS